MADGLHYYEWFFNDWLASGTRADMTLEERAIYRDLLDHQAAQGYLPDNIYRLASRAGCSKDQMAGFLERWGDKLFPVVDGVRQNTKLKDNRDSVIRRLDNKRTSGKMGSDARWGVKNGDANGDANGTANGDANGTANAGAMAIVANADVMASQNQNQNQNKDKYYCPESKTSDIRWSTTADGGWIGITDNDRKKWAEAFPNCDINQQLSVMDAWLQANPTKANKKNWRRFIVNWFSSEQKQTVGSKNNGSSKGTRRDVIHDREKLDQGAEKIKPKRIDYTA